MRPIQRVISIGFAAAAVAAGSLPALSGTVWPDVDFEWYANVGKVASNAVTAQPATTASEDIAVIPGQEPPRGADRAAPPVATGTNELSARAPATSQPGGRIAPSLPDSQLVSPTLPATGSNRR
jgi:hypothetical protein